jgi:hypothetical protein
VARTGFAAHIHAAAKGGKRYSSTQTPAERSDIANGIWLCAKHATLIDQDKVTYTADRLREMRKAHEFRIDTQHRESAPPPLNTSGLVAIGPNLIFIGDIIGSSGTHWSVCINQFVVGNLMDLVRFSEQFDEFKTEDRYLIVNTMGDGRIIVDRPEWRRTEGGILIDLQLEPRFPRIPAQELGADVPLTSDGEDIDFEAPLVSEVDNLPTLIQCCLSQQRGASLSQNDFGTRLSEFHHRFGALPYFADLAKLEVIRMAAIPTNDELLDCRYTPLQCVRVRAKG